MQTIDVASVFSRYPGGRYERDGDHSGEQFRRSVLVPSLRSAISHNDLVVVRLDGVMGYPASFLDEAFGGLIREEGFSYGQVMSHLKLLAGSPRFETYRQLILKYLEEARIAPAGN